MFIDNIKITEFKKKIRKPMIIIAIILALIFYFRIFFTKGIYFDNTFLKKETKPTETIYSGSCIYGDLRITVQGVKNQDSSAKVIYQLTNAFNQSYIVEFKDPNSWDDGIKAIRDENENIVFEGDYDRDSEYLIQKNGEPYIDIVANCEITGQNMYDNNYKINLYNVVEMAYSSLDTIRGEFMYLVMAAAFFLIAFIDYKFPLFFFMLKHWADVDNPEPSDFYLLMQKIARFAYPIIGVIAMIVALLHIQWS